MLNRLRRYNVSASLTMVFGRPDLSATASKAPDDEKPFEIPPSMRASTHRGLLGHAPNAGTLPRIPAGLRDSVSRERRDSLVKIHLTDRPVFVVGSPRSGTTILAWSLSRHSQLWTSGESYLAWELFGTDRAVRSMDALFETAAVLGTGALITSEVVSRAELLAHMGMGINALLTKRSHPRRWIDHTPKQTLMMDTLAQMFPDALFLHILRNGAEVVDSLVNFDNALEPEVKASMERAGWRLPFLEFDEACRTWRSYAQAALDFEAAQPQRCLTVRHDQLTNDTRACLNRIYGFLGVSFEEEPVQFISRQRAHSSFLDEGSRRQWKTEQSLVFKREAGTMMTRLGYGW